MFTASRIFKNVLLISLVLDTFVMLVMFATWLKWTATRGKLWTVERMWLIGCYVQKEPEIPDESIVGEIWMGKCKKVWVINLMRVLLTTCRESIWRILLITITVTSRIALLLLTQVPKLYCFPLGPHILF